MSETLQRARELYLGRRVQVSDSREGRDIAGLGFVVNINGLGRGINVTLHTGYAATLDRVDVLTEEQMAGPCNHFTRTFKVVPATVRIYRAPAAEVGGCCACVTEPRPETVNVIETDPAAGRGGVVLTSRFCDACADQLADGLAAARQLRKK
jgi:hypothetical protein